MHFELSIFSTPALEITIEADSTAEYYTIVIAF